MPSLFLGNSKQHMPIYAKTISSWVRKVLSIAKADIYLGTHQGSVVSAALPAGVSLVSILHGGDCARVLLQLVTIFNMHDYDKSVPKFSSAWCTGP